MRSSCRVLMVTSANSATASATARQEGSRAAEQTTLRSTVGLESWEVSRKPGRCGKKIPAAGRAVAHGLGGGDRATPEVDGPGLASDGAGPSTRRTRLLGPPPRGLALQQSDEGAAGDGAGGDDGHRLAVVGVEIELGPDLLVDGSGHDFSPTLRERLDAVSIHRW
jgi:hypothetical protein